MRRICFAIVSILAAVLLTGCKSTLKTYYPLKQNATYHFEASGGDALVPRFVDVTILPSRDLKGRRVTPRRNTFTGLPSNMVFLAEDENGISIVGIQNINSDEPTIFSTPSYVIKTPILLGASWESPSWKATIESVSDDVTVPAGSFSKCVRIKRTTATGGNTVETTSWYAPEVGTVKDIRKTITPAGVTIAQENLQLHSYKFN
jgi:hypothetical protein